jgi:hypothetical protein
MKFNHSHLYAYALGYYDGVVKGVSENPFGHDAQEERYLYSEGYEKGVFDYCQTIEEEKETL